MNNTTRFTDKVDDYVRYRPHYPAASILGWLQENAGFNASAVVADIGAGTGISAELFLRNGNKVYGVEPNDAMRVKSQELLSGYPAFVAVNGTAEDTTLPDASVDLVVAGTAFHWFDPVATKKEFARICKGYIVLMWNVREIRTPFEQEYEALLREFGNGYKEKEMDYLPAFFAPLSIETVAFENDQLLSYEGVQGRLLSTSYIPADNPSMLSKLKEIFERYAVAGKVVFGYTTRVYMGKK
jgi:SAM-dependent methyltransferase